MKIQQTLLMLLLFVLVSSCSPQQTEVLSFRQDIDWHKETPASIKGRISSSAPQIAILSAFFSLNMNPPPANMMSSLSGVITIDTRMQQPRVRILALHVFGSTLFDMVNTDTTKIYVPRKKTLYVGTKEDQDQNTKGPQTIFAHMMLEPTDLVLDQDKPLHIGTDVVTLYLEDGWLTLDKQSGLITGRHKDDLDIGYAAYMELENKARIPTKISITTTGQSFTAHCTLSQVAMLESLPETFFDLAEYKPEMVKALQDLQ